MLRSRSVTDLDCQAELLRRHRYGVIEVADGQLVHVRFRPFPKLVWWLEARTLGAWRHRRRQGNFCRLYYNQPRGHGNFLALVYVESTRGTTLATFRGALAVLDEIARIKGTDALLCDVSNPRISARLLMRWGWEPHARQRWHRNYIKRFYGRYPSDYLLKSPNGEELEINKFQA